MHLCQGDGERDTGSPLPIQMLQHYDREQIEELLSVGHNLQ